MMKMIFKPLHWGLHLVLAMLAAGLVFLGITFHNTLQSHSKQGDALMDVRDRISTLVKGTGFSAIRRSLLKGESDKGHERLIRLNQEVKELGSMLGLDISESLEKSFQEHKQAIQDGAGMSRPSELITVLTSKVKHFNSMASQSKWKNLSRISERMLVRLASLSTANLPRSSMPRYLESDLSSLLQITEASTLEEREKESIKSRLEAMQVEVELLGRFSRNARDGEQAASAGDKALADWLGDANLYAGQLRERQASELRKILNMVWACLGGLLAGWGLLTGLLFLRQNKSQKVMEEKVDQVLKVPAGEEAGQWEEGLSIHCVQQIEARFSGLRARLSFGSEFQEAMPFSSCLLNKEGRITWANKIFLEQFYLSEEEVHKEFLGWPEIRRQLQLPEGDPVDFAFKEKVPGIYQAKLLVGDNPIPLEIHVSHVNAGDAEKVMLVFYPLVFVQEVIRHQAELLVASVQNALALTEKHQFGLEQRTELKPEFSGTGMPQLWQTICQINDNTMSERAGLMKKIDELEATQNEMHKLIREVEMSLSQQSPEVRGALSALKELRGSLINMGVHHEDGWSVTEALGTENQQRKQELAIIIKSVRQMLEAIVESYAASKELEVAKDDYRQSRQELMESKNRLISVHSSFVSAIPQLDGRSSGLASRMKEEFMKLEQVVAQVDKKMTTLDVRISKLVLLFEGDLAKWRQSVELPDLRFDDSWKTKLEQVRDALAGEEEMAILKLKEIYDILGQELRHIKEAQDLIDTHKGQLATSNDEQMLDQRPS